MTQHPEQRRLTLTQEIARRMHQVGGDLPENDSGEVRTKYEAMADAARNVTAERLREFSDAVLRECLSKHHRGSKQPDSGGHGGAPCPQCRTQIRYMRAALKVVEP